MSTSDSDIVAVYAKPSFDRANGIGGVDWEIEEHVTIDMRSTYKREAIDDVRAHAVKVRDELLRIIKSKVANPSADFNKMLPGQRTDFSNLSAGRARFVIDVILWRYESE